MGDEEETRSGLFFDALRVIKEMREQSYEELRDKGADDDIRLLIKPRYAVYENVPGALSSNNGEDFRIVLEETARIVDKDAVIPRPNGKWSNSGCIMGNGWSIAWRIHDAQFWGVAQRRRRLSLIGDFAGQSAPEILFERKGVSGDISESDKEGQDITATSGENPYGTISFQERGGKAWRW